MHSKSTSSLCARTLLLVSTALLIPTTLAYTTVPLVISNRCSDTIWPGVNTQNGTLPEFANNTASGSSSNEDPQGFALAAGASRNLTILTDWNGRVWGRTNCTFDSQGLGRCGTGDCGGGLRCTGTNEPATLAEFNLPAYQNQSFYDISLVDGYNLPIAIQVIYPEGGNAVPVSQRPPANVTNPSCVASLDGMDSPGWTPYTSSNSRLQQFLGTSPQEPLPFEDSVSLTDARDWCPDQDLVISVGAEQSDPNFRPCMSACKKWGNDFFCCTGQFEKDIKCPTSFYSDAAKRVCPDAYSYAYDDASSTFAVPMGSGFEVVFCPGGRSTIIQKTIGNVASSRFATSPIWAAAVAAVAVVGLSSVIV